MPKAEEKLWTKCFCTILGSHFIFFLGFYMLAPTLPLYIKSLGGNSAQIGLVSTGYAIASIIMRFVVPFLQEKWPRKTLLRAGIAAVFVLAVIYCFAHSVASVIVLRLLQGLGFGIITTFAGTMAADAAPPSRLGEAVALFGMATTGAVALAPAFGLFIMEHFGFPAMFIIAAVIISVSMISWSTVNLPDPPKLPASTDGRLHFWSRIYDTRIAFQTVLLACYGIARGTQQSFLTVMATEEGLSMISLYSIVETGITFVFRFVSRKWYDRRGPNLMVLLGGVMSTVAFFLFSITRSNAMLLTAAVSNGIAMAAIVPTFQTWIMEAVGAQRRTLGSALYFNVSDLGTAVGAAVMGIVADSVGYHGTFRCVMFVMLFYILFWIIGTVVRRKRAKPSTGDDPT